MNEWIHRHLQLTREERLLLAAIILIVITGIAAWKYRTAEPVTAESQESRQASSVISSSAAD